MPLAVYWIARCRRPAVRAVVVENPGVYVEFLRERRCCCSCMSSTFSYPESAFFHRRSNGVLGLTVNYSAYEANYRAGLLAVPR